MDGSKTTGVWEAGQKGLGAAEEKLDRALVAGLMLEVILETAGSPANPQAYRHLVKTRLKDTLVTHLAGRVTLDRFHHLLRKLDHWFPLYYPLITAGSPQGPGRAVPVPATPGSPSWRGLREDRLRAWLQEEGRSLLPHRPHRKLTEDKFQEFLRRTQGDWFRLRDFEQHFGVDRKTAWEYLHKFLHAGLLRHNQGRSAAVRYALAAHFLVVRADALEPKVREALSGLPPSLTAPVSGRLLAAGGESFWQEEWHDCLEPRRCQQVITRLQAAGILEEVCQVGERRLLRIGRRWLRE